MVRKILFFVISFIFMWVIATYKTPAVIGAFAAIAWVAIMVEIMGVPWSFIFGIAKKIEDQKIRTKGTWF